MADNASHACTAHWSVEADSNRDWPQTQSESHSHTATNLFVGVLPTPEQATHVMCYLMRAVLIQYSSSQYGR